MWNAGNRGPARPVTIPISSHGPRIEQALFMRITSVELTNIKSYRHAVITFDKGTTAIRGRNGAGKSTLVEAIGFALFDALPYKQVQFVREGERVGVVAVTFLSALDDRQSQVVRKCE